MNTDNSLLPRTLRANALHPQASHTINRYTRTESPMPNKVNDQVYRLARTAKEYDSILFTDVMAIYSLIST